MAPSSMEFRRNMCIGLCNVLLLSPTQSLSIVNQQVFSFFGLRQGDSFSPYLFIMVMEVPSRLIHKEINSEKLQGIKISRNGPRISYLFFADDSLIFFKATSYSYAKIKDVLHRFSYLSGEVINYNKSLIMFTPNSPSRFKLYM